MADKTNSLKSIADAAVLVAVKQVETAARFQQPRFDDIRKNEDMYLLKDTPALYGRNNIPFDGVLMQGFITTLISKIDESINIEFDSDLDEKKRSAKKLNYIYQQETAADRADWNSADLEGKKLAALSGRAITKLYIESDPEFCAKIAPIDHFDFLCEPQGGRDLDKHLYKGQKNIFRSKEDIEDRAKRGIYDNGQANELFSRVGNSELKKNDELYKNKLNRALVLGLDTESNNYVGVEMYRLIEWVMYYKGEWYYMLFHYETATWIRFDKLKNVFSVAKRFPGRGPWSSWATDIDSFNFWSLSPADQIRPVAAYMKKIVNLTADNLEKRNWDMTAYDPKVFTDPRQLIFRQNGLVKATLKPGESINNHIFKFQTPDTTAITINLLEYFNGFLGEQSGITRGAKGVAETDKVGIAFANLEQVADRIGLTNKLYVQHHINLGQMFKFGVADHLPKKYITKITGPRGLEVEEFLTSEELTTDLKIVIRGGNAEQKANMAITAKKQLALDRIAKDPSLAGRANASVRLREELRIAGYNEEEIRQFLDTQNDADSSILQEAAEAIAEIVDEGTMPKLNRGANMAYVERVYSEAYDNDGLDDKQFNMLLDYVKKTLPVARRNEIMKMRLKMAQQGADMAGQRAPSAEAVNGIGGPANSTPTLTPSVGNSLGV